MPKIDLSVLLKIITVVLLFWGCSQAEVNEEPEQQLDTDPLLLISIDGFMPEYHERNETPNLDRIARQGVLAESMITVFPTKTFPAHYSIVTGLYPEEHGIISNEFYDYKLDARFSYGPPEEGPDDGKWWGGEPIWVTVENQSGIAATMFWPGSDSEIMGVQPTRYKDYDGSFPNEARIDSVVSWLDRSGDVRADFSTLYFSDVDSYGHRYGPYSEEVDEQVLEADRLIGYLLDRIEEAGLAGQLNMIIVSDHGMAELSKERVIYLDEKINLDDVELIDWTPVAMIRPAEGKAEEVYRSLKANEEHYTVYRKDELPAKYRFTNHYRIPEIIMVADLGYSITTREFIEQRGLIAGTHGYDPFLPEMHAFFLAQGPAFQENVNVETLESIHLYELMTHILGLDPADNDGTLQNVLHLLR